MNANQKSQSENEEFYPTEVNFLNGTCVESFIDGNTYDERYSKSSMPLTKYDS